MSQCRIISIGLIFLITIGLDACVDRINFDLPDQSPYPVVIDGFISDQLPPYEVTVTRAYDIQSKNSTRERISVKRLVLSDESGMSEELVEVSQGVYQTAGLIRGKVGSVYKLYIKLLDGREYESIPDTLHPGGRVDKVYFEFNEERTQHFTTEYGFDVFFDASSGEQDDYRFLWKFVGTYRVKIVCCECWPYLYNEVPIVSDGQLIQSDHFMHVKAAYIPINQWTFYDKVHAAVNQMSLSRNTYEFWRAIKLQQEAVGSLFQPITGKIPNNFRQLSGPAGSMYGIFYATSITSNAVYINKSDVPNPLIIPELFIPKNPYPPKKCIDQFPGSSDQRPWYWVD